MAKTPKLNQIVTVEKNVKSRAMSEITKLHHDAQKTALFDGFTRTYSARTENGESVPAETKRVQMTVQDLLNRLTETQVELYDTVATKDYANQEATADVMVDGKVLIAKAPVSYLLFLEKQLTDLRTFVSKLPLLDPAEEWTLDASTGVFKSAQTQTNRTKKEPRVVQKFQPTEHHPGQAEVIHEDIVIGTFTATKMSGAMQKAKNSELLARLDLLMKVVKVAREEANDAPAPKKSVGEVVFKYIFDGK